MHLRRAPKLDDVLLHSWERYFGQQICQGCCSGQACRGQTDKYHLSWFLHKLNPSCSLKGTAACESAKGFPTFVLSQASTTGHKCLKAYLLHFCSRGRETSRRWRGPQQSRWRRVGSPLSCPTSLSPRRPESPPPYSPSPCKWDSQVDRVKSEKGRSLGKKIRFCDSWIQRSFQGRPEVGLKRKLHFSWHSRCTFPCSFLERLFACSFRSFSFFGPDCQAICGITQFRFRTALVQKNSWTKLKFLWTVSVARDVWPVSILSLSSVRSLWFFGSATVEPPPHTHARWQRDKCERGILLKNDARNDEDVHGQPTTQQIVRLAIDPNFEARPVLISWDNTSIFSESIFFCTMTSRLVFWGTLTGFFRDLCGLTSVSSAEPGKHFVSGRADFGKCSGRISHVDFFEAVCKSLGVIEFPTCARVPGLPSISLMLPQGFRDCYGWTNGDVCPSNEHANVLRAISLQYVKLFHHATSIWGAISNADERELVLITR